jgi:endonuclease/exonuclease/phosphatase family metal-dependent hydrolase
VVALQEVENIGLLSRLNTDELASLGYKEVRLSPGNDMRGINVALLSRFPVVKFMSHAGDRFQGVDGDQTTYGFSRDCLEVRLEAGPGRFLTLLINHLAATESPDAVPRRHAQAAQVRRIADDTLKYRPDANLAVVGDLNDTPGSKTLQLIQTGTPPLFDLLTLVPASQRFTFYYGSQKEQIDYILVSPGLKSDLQAGSVLADHATVFKNASDHYPVVARFTLE